MLTAALLASLFQAVAVASPPAKDPAPLFAALAGRWSCAGAFANGKLLKADLAFEPSFQGRTLRYTHVDKAPNTYQQHSTWGVDAGSGHLVSLAFLAFKPGPGEPALYVSEDWSPKKVTFVHKKLLKDPFAPNRFTYSVAGDTLKMLWEVERKGMWRMGDFLECKRATVRR